MGLFSMPAKMITKDERAGVFSQQRKCPADLLCMVTEVGAMRSFLFIPRLFEGT
jgi:hypothetical protein